MPIKIATWNINGVRARIDNLVAWLKESNPDIVGLQEIKTVDEGFPRAEVEALGYHVETHGQKGFNGVALLSKIRPDEVNRGLPGGDGDEQSRFIEGVYSVEGGVIRFCSLYLPNGNPADDPVTEQEGQDIVTVCPLGERRIDLDAIEEIEDAMRAVAFPDQRIERCEQGARIDPARLAGLRIQVGRPIPALDRHRQQVA